MICNCKRCGIEVDQCKDVCFCAYYVFASFMFVFCEKCAKTVGVPDKYVKNNICCRFGNKNNLKKFLGKYWFEKINWE
jgi:hypothetical protein